MAEELTTDYRELGKDPRNRRLDTAVTSWVHVLCYYLSSLFKGALVRTRRMGFATACGANVQQVETNPINSICS